MHAKKQQIGANSTLPVTISSIRLIGGAQHTRRSFLDRLFNPLLSANRDRPYTLAEALREVDGVATKLQRFGTPPALGLFIYLHLQTSTTPASAPLLIALPPQIQTRQSQI